MDEQPPKPASLADDPAFLDSLDGLDRGLIADDGGPANSLRARSATAVGPPAVSRPAGASSSTSRAGIDSAPARPRDLYETAAAADAEETPAAEETPSRRWVLDLFPPVAGEARHQATPDTRTAPGAPAPLPRSARVRPPAPSALSRPVPLAAHRRPAPRPSETFYGLGEPPFGPAPDPRFFYYSTIHDEAMQELLTAIRRREGIVLVTGPQGTGKTTVCRTVVEQLDRRTLTSFVADAPESVEQIVQAALVDFGVLSVVELAHAQPPLPELLIALREFLISLAALEAFAVLFVDDAQRLPAAVLREIPRLAETGLERRLLQIVLVGTSALERRLKRPDLRPLASEVTIRCRVGPLEESETAGYLAHRLAVASTNVRVEFAADAVRRLHHLSRGIPLLTDRIADAALEIGAAASASTIDAPAIDQAARKVGIDPPESAVARVMRMAVLALAVVLLVLAGAGVAAYVFRDRLTAAVSSWERVPRPPRRPAPPASRPLQPPPAPAVPPRGL